MPTLLDRKGLPQQCLGVAGNSIGDRAPRSDALPPLLPQILGLVVRDPRAANRAATKAGRSRYPRGGAFLHRPTASQSGRFDERLLHDGSERCHELITFGRGNLPGGGKTICASLSALH